MGSRVNPGFPPREFLFGPGERLSIPSGSLELVAQVSRGGLSEVHVARDHDGFHHILKVALPQSFLTRESTGSTAYEVARLLDPLERSRREGLILDRINHPNIIKVHGLVPDIRHGCAGLLMERVDNALTLYDIARPFWDPDSPWPHMDAGDFKHDDLERLVSGLGERLAPFQISDVFPDDLLRSPDLPKLIPDRFLEGGGLSADQLLELFFHLEKAEREGGFHALDYRSDRGFADRDRDGTWSKLQSETVLDPVVGRLRRLQRQLFKQVQDAQRYLEEIGIAHKDLTLSNVIVDSLAHARLIDFGLAGNIDEPTWFARSTRPPEVSRGRIHRRSERFSLGVLLFQLLHGHHPLSRASDPQEIGRKCEILSQLDLGRQELRDRHILPIAWSELVDHIGALEIFFSLGVYRPRSERGISPGSWSAQRHDLLLRIEEQLELLSLLDLDPAKRGSAVMDSEKILENDRLDSYYLSDLCSDIGTLFQRGLFQDLELSVQALPEPETQEANRTLWIRGDTSDQ